MTRTQIQEISAATATYRAAYGYIANANNNDLTIAGAGSSSGDNEQISITVSEVPPTEESLRLTLLHTNSSSSTNSSAASKTLIPGTAAGLDPDDATVVINEAFCIRDDGDKFGRGFNNLRMSLTANDTVPLKTR